MEIYFSQLLLWANRGDCIRHKKECLRLNVLTAAKLPWYLSILRQASRSTVKRAFQNICLIGQKESVQATGLTRNTHGHNEETAGKNYSKKSQRRFSSNTAHTSTRFSYTL